MDNPDMQLDVQQVINSLTSQIAQQAQKIAMLEATVASLSQSLTAAREEKKSK
jgi:flagellar biosynthesis chaperone FliJ